MYVFTAITCAIPTSPMDNAVIDCALASTDANSDVIYSGECTYTCESGFADTGDGKITCGDDGDQDVIGGFTATQCERKLKYHIYIFIIYIDSWV